MGVREERFLGRMFNGQEKHSQKAPDEQDIQPASQRQRHGGRGRAHRRLPIASRTRARDPRAPTCGACSDAPDAANAGTIMTKAAARAVGGIRTSAASGWSWSPPCPAWTAPGAESWSRRYRGPSPGRGSPGTSRPRSSPTSSTRAPTPCSRAPTASSRTSNDGREASATWTTSPP